MHLCNHNYIHTKNESKYENTIRFGNRVRDL